MMSTSTTLRVSLAQIDLQFGDPEANFEKARSRVEEARHMGSELVVLPELWSTAYALEHWPQFGCALSTGMFERVAALAREQRISVVGSLLEVEGGRAYNTMTLHGTDGTLLAWYRKVHLVPMLDEPRWLTAGNRLALVQAPWGSTGLGICYDLRFPEIWRTYAIGGAQIFIISAEWPSSRIAHWHALLRARAIENQAYVVACNRVGTTKDVEFGGQSVVLNPWGDVIVEAGSKHEALLSAEVDFAKVDEIRNAIPVLSGRRPELY